MKKIISLAVCFVMPFVLMGAKTAEDTPPTTSAQAFVLYCPDNNTVICSKMQMKNEACEHYKNYDISHNA